MKLKNLIEIRLTKIRLAIFLLTFGANASFAAEGISIILQPDGTCGIDALIGNCVPCGYDNSNFGDGEEFNALAWTNGGSISDHRSLIKFDLSGIPTSANVLNATLTLFYNPTSSNASGLHSQTSGSNEAYIQEITSAWDEHTVTWNNQPSTTSNNQAYVPASLTSTQDYQVDITAIVQDFVNNPSLNNGMMIKLISESYYRCLLFASSDHPNPALHPKLEITYSPKDTSCFTFQPESCDGIDALIGDCVPCGYDTSNFGNTEEMNALAWTNGGAISNHRSLIKWNFDNIPTNATIISADLSLFFNPTSGNAGGLHSTTSGPNDSYLQKITSPWDEYTVTWNNQPSTTNVNQAYLPASITSTQDYTNIDVTALIQDLVNNPNANWGLMLKLDSESYYRCLLFASSDHPDRNLHPKLDVCYSVIDNAVTETSNVKNVFKVYPNPSNGSFNLSFHSIKGKSDLEIFNSIGEVVYSKNLEELNSDMQLQLSLASGIYMARLTNNNKSYTQKVTIN